jgi:hypothetical protein
MKAPATDFVVWQQPHQFVFVLAAYSQPILDFDS